MNKEDNVYFTLAQQFKGLKSSPIQIYVGSVTSIAPLLINCAGMQLDSKDLLINKDILKGTKRDVKITADEVTGNVVTEHGGRLDSFNMSSGTIENMEDKFEIGSEVVLMTEDNQKFILLCEVV